jgi:hypothetical protein
MATDSQQIVSGVGLAFGSGLWETMGMKKPELRVKRYGSNQAPIEAECSSCGTAIPSFISTRGGTPQENMAELQEAFDRHFKEMHLREDASQAAARIVREATEGR